MSSYHHIHAHLHHSVLHAIGICYFLHYVALVLKYKRQHNVCADLRDLQCDPALAEGARPVEGRHDEPEPASITLPLAAWISPHGNIYNTAPSCVSLTSTVSIQKGLCAYCHNRDLATANAKRKDTA